MPCYEPKYVHSQGDAILCSVLHKAEAEGKLNELIDSMDYDLIGLTREQVLKWWANHKELDAKRLKERA